LQVSFAWIDDSNPDNNLGQKNTQVGVSHSPVAFEFQLRNSKRFVQNFRFETDSYAIPPLPSCVDRGGQNGNRTRGGRQGGSAQRPFEPVKVPPQHDRQNYPLPAGWSVTFVPPNPQLTPEQEITVLATVIPPAGFIGRQAVNVHTFGEAGLAGGLTFYVEGS
jgi:hypothetical protein